MSSGSLQPGTSARLIAPPQRSVTSIILTRIAQLAVIGVPIIALILLIFYPLAAITLQSYFQIYMLEIPM